MNELKKKTGEVYRWKGKLISLSALSRALNERGYGRGTTVSNLSKIFSGEYDPRFEMVKALAEIMDVTLEEIDELLQTCRRARSTWRALMDETAEDSGYDRSCRVSNPKPEVA